jgi:hypothetical protein
MKVTRAKLNKGNFVPVVLILEDQEEITQMFCYFNNVRIIVESLQLIKQRDKVLNILFKKQKNYILVWDKLAKILK